MRNLLMNTSAPGRRSAATILLATLLCYTSLLASTLGCAPVDAPNSAPIHVESPQADAAEPANNLVVHVIDVGQGDAILIQTPNGAAALIDGGEADSGVVEYLEKAGIARLRYVIATHPHSDHIGGLPEVLSRIPVDEVVTNGQSHNTPAYERFLDAVADSGAVYTEARRGDLLELGGMELEVLYPVSVETEDLNNNSLVIRLVHCTVSFLFMADAEMDAEASLLALGQELHATVLKIGHHGSRTSSSAAFVQRVAPKVAIYSAAEGNSYGHPHAETLAVLAELGATIYGTDVNGTVIISSSPHEYSVSTEKRGTPRAPPTPTPMDTLTPTDTPLPQEITATQPPETATDTPSPPALTNTPSPPTPTRTPSPPTPTRASEASEAGELALSILSITSPVRRDANARLVARTIPGAQCTIAVHYKSGPSQAEGLEPQLADGRGNVSWEWRVGRATTPGTWRIVVTASADGHTVSEETAFEVIE